MNNKTIVKLSNIIGITSIILLIYWVFTFTVTEVFGLKVFREGITQTFRLSIVGILSLMAGALIVNIMFNLTRIAEKHNNDVIVAEKKTSKKLGLLLLLIFPLILLVLFAGDYQTVQRKEKLLINSAVSIVQYNAANTDKLHNYSFSKKYIQETSQILELHSNTDTHFNTVSVIVADSVQNANVFLRFSSYYSTEDTLTKPKKQTYLFPSTKEERDYLSKVFYKNMNEMRFIADDGEYELFYPVIRNGRKIVFYFTDSQQYGKM